MARSCIFFLVLILLGNARGGRVLREQSAQNGQSDSEKAFQAPHSLSPEQQTSSVSSGVQSFEVGGTNDDGSSNGRTNLVRLIPNTPGASSSSDKLSSVAQNDASGPVSAPASGVWAGEVNAQGFPKTSLSSQAQNEQTTQADEPLRCAHPRRRNPSYRVRVLFKPPSPTDQFDNGSQGTGIWSPSQGQNIPSASGFTFQTQPSNLVAFSQSLGTAPMPSQQGGFNVQSSWYATKGQNNPLATGPSILGPSQSSPVPAEQGEYGFQSRWSASQDQNFQSVSQPNQYSNGLQAQSLSRPMATQTPGESDLASEAQFGSSSYTSAQSQGVQSTLFESLKQSPGVQTQTLYKPAFPSQDLASLSSSPLQSQAGSESVGVKWHLVSSDGLSALQRGSLTQGGDQPPAIQSNGRFFTSSQNAASPLASVAQSSMTEITPSMSLSLGQTSAESVASEASSQKNQSAAWTASNAHPYVWNGQLAQNWQRSEEQNIQDPPSRSSEQQASSVASGVQSIELGATNTEGSTNVPTRHVRLKTNGLGVSSYGDEFNANLVAPSNGFISNTYPSRLDRIGNGLFSAREGSQRSLQGLQTQYDPPLQIQESSRVDTFQNSGSTSLPLQQAGYGDQSETDRLEVQRIPFGSEAPSQSLGSPPAPLQTEGYGIPSRWSAFQVQGIHSASRPALQTQPSDFVAPSRTVGSAPVPPQQEVTSAQSASEVQRILLTSWPISQDQPLDFLTPSQSFGGFPVPSRQDGYSIPSRWSAPQVQGIPSDSQPALQNQPSNIVVPSQSLGSAPVPSQQVQRIPLAGQHTFQTQPTNLLAQTQSLGSAPVPSHQGGYDDPSRWSAPQMQGIPIDSRSALQTQPSALVLPFQSLGSAPLQSQQDRDGFQSRWPAAEIKSIFLNRPRFQSQVSNLVAPSQSVAGLPRPLQEDGYGFQSRQSSSQMQGIPSATLPVLQTQPSNLVAPFQSLESAPVQSPQDSDSFYTRWPAAEIPNVPSSAQPIFQGHLSDVVASHEQLSGASLPSQHNRYEPQSSLFTSREQNIPLTAGPALNHMDPSQSFSNALRLSAQDGYNAQSRWPASHERIPSASQPPQYGPVFQTQSSSRPVPSSWGLANQFTSQYTSQGSRSQNAPADQSPHAQLSGVAVSSDVGSSLPTSLQSQDVPLSWFDGLHQVPPVQTQTLYKPVFPSQERTSVFSSLSQAQARADPSEHVLCFKVSSAALAEALQSNKPVTQPQSLESLLYNPTASSSLPSSSQRESAPALTAAQTQSGVQPPAVVYRSRFPPSTQKPAIPTASVAQSVSSSPAKTSAEHLASDLSKKIPGDSWTELTERDLD